MCLEGDDGSVLLDASRGDLSVLVVLVGHGSNVGDCAAVCFALVLEVVVQGDHDEDNTSNNSEADDEGGNLGERALGLAGHGVSPCGDRWELFSLADISTIHEQSGGSQPFGTKTSSRVRSSTCQRQQRQD